MLKIVFPQHNNQHYWNIHFKYLLSIFEYAQCKISFYKREDAAIIIKVNGKEFEFNYWDDSSKFEIKLMPIFKYHCIEEQDNLFTFTPVSFYDWDLYKRLKKEIKYKAKGLISSRQRPYGNALSRRHYVQRLLREKFHAGFVFEQISYQSFLEEIGKCLVGVCVPGFCNNMLDRGHLQQLALGMCTISPNIPEILPFNRKLEVGVHYLRCNDKYTDLVETINWCKKNRNKCVEIGQNAKKLFEDTSTPEKLCEWIESKL